MISSYAFNLCYSIEINWDDTKSLFTEIKHLLNVHITFKLHILTIINYLSDKYPVQYQ